MKLINLKVCSRTDIRKELGFHTLTSKKLVILTASIKMSHTHEPLLFRPNGVCALVVFIYDWKKKSQKLELIFAKVFQFSVFKIQLKIKESLNTT